MDNIIKNLPPSLREALEKKNKESLVEEITAFVGKEKAKELFEQEKQKGCGI